MTETNATKDRLNAILARTRHDTDLRRHLAAEPKAVLAEHGIEIPEGVTVAVVEDTPERVHLVLPPVPGEGELSDAALDAVAGAGKIRRPR